MDIKLLTISALVLFSLWGCLSKTGKSIGLGINHTASQHPGVYIYFPIFTPLKHGDLVDADLNLSKPQLRWIKSRHYLKEKEKLIKTIGATSDDWLLTVYPRIYACPKNELSSECILLGSCLQKDTNKLNMTCQNWHGERIPKNHFYLKSDYVRNSFDSRYFGLVSIQNIHHRLINLLKFST